MKEWLFLALGLLGIALVLLKTRERFEPQFFDMRQTAKTVAVEDSSYQQSTNHADPSPYSTGAILGSETPFQVNQYKAFVV